MRYCRVCDAEYDDSVKSCSDCDLPLLDKAEWSKLRLAKIEHQERLRDKELTPLCVVGGPLEAERILSLLEDGGILALLRSFQDTEQPLMN